LCYFPRFKVHITITVLPEILSLIASTIKFLKTDNIGIIGAHQIHYLLVYGLLPDQSDLIKSAGVKTHHTNIFLMYRLFRKGKLKKGPQKEIAQNQYKGRKP